VDNLVRKHNYTFEVIAVNERGESDPIKLEN
jgi:hypothetical protein